MCFWKLRSSQLKVGTPNYVCCLLQQEERQALTEHFCSLALCDSLTSLKVVSAKKTGSQNRISLQCREQLRPVASTVVSKTEYITCQTFLGVTRAL